MSRSSLLVFLTLSFLASCQGPDPIRISAERANFELARRCADGWFQKIPFTAEDVRMVNNAFGDWDKSLKAEEALINFPIRGGER